MTGHLGPLRRYWGVSRPPFPWLPWQGNGQGLPGFPPGFGQGQGGPGDNKEDDAKKEQKKKRCVCSHHQHDSVVRSASSIHIAPLRCVPGCRGPFSTLTACCCKFPPAYLFCTRTLCVAFAASRTVPRRVWADGNAAPAPPPPRRSPKVCCAVVPSTIPRAVPWHSSYLFDAHWCEAAMDQPAPRGLRA